MDDDTLVRCYVCVPSGVVRTSSAHTYRLVRKCHPACEG